MKKKIFATAPLGLLAANVLGPVALAADDKDKEQSSKTDVTLIPGSGTDVEPVVPDDTHDDDSETGDTGALSIPYASNITFGSQEIKAKAADYYALNEKPHVQVNDTRGGAKGWALSVKISPFKGENDKVLAGAEMSLLKGKVKTTKNASAAPTVGSDELVLNDTPQLVMSAKAGQGAGAWATVFEGTDGKNENVKLHVPQGVIDAQSYTAELTWVLSDAPF